MRFIHKTPTSISELLKEKVASQKGEASKNDNKEE